MVNIANKQLHFLFAFAHECMLKLNGLKSIKMFFKSFNVFETCLFTGIFVLPIVFAIAFKSTFVEVSSTLTYCFGAFLTMKGKPLARIINIIASLFYAAVSYQSSYYGEVLITFFITIPMITWSFIEWILHKRKDKDLGDVVIVAHQKPLEIGLLFLSQAVMAVGYYFVLKHFGTEFLSVSTISIVTSVIATYFLARRNKLAFWGFILNDIILIILWGHLVIAGDLHLLGVLLMPALLLISDTYGIINWKRLERRQSVQDNQAPSIS
jgi:nicotinamide mononucleotide transporter PnuC